MHAKFCIGVPHSKVKEEVENNFVVIGREESFKYWNSTLEIDGTSITMSNSDRINLTCNRSSKSRAARPFIADVFVWKRLIVPLPKVGT
jgi:hypothetical protein